MKADGDAYKLADISKTIMVKFSLGTNTLLINLLLSHYFQIYAEVYEVSQVLLCTQGSWYMVCVFCTVCVFTADGSS